MACGCRAAGASSRYTSSAATAPRPRRTRTAAWTDPTAAPLPSSTMPTLLKAGALGWSSPPARARAGASSTVPPAPFAAPSRRSSTLTVPSAKACANAKARPLQGVTLSSHLVGRMLESGCCRCDTIITPARHAHLLQGPIRVLGVKSDVRVDREWRGG
eukprot:1178194-Prorocentrum_minimum.AAC.2